MGLGCTICGKCTNDRSFTHSHWLCRSHRRKSARAIFKTRTNVSETELVQSLACTFPPHCDSDEFFKRVGYASDIWITKDKVRAVCSAHNLRGWTVAPGLDRLGVLTMVERLVSFICRSVSNHACLRDHMPILHHRVRGWYPKFARSGTRALMLRSEQMVHELYHTTGQWEFLVLSTLAVTIGRKLPADLVERIYSSYIDLIATPNVDLAGFA